MVNCDGWISFHRQFFTKGRARTRRTRRGECDQTAGAPAVCEVKEIQKTQTTSYQAVCVFWISFRLAARSAGGSHVSRHTVENYVKPWSRREPRRPRHCFKLKPYPSWPSMKRPLVSTPHHLCVLLVLCCRSTKPREDMGPWGEAGRPSIRALGEPSVPTAAQHAIRGVRRNLRDGRRGDHGHEPRSPPFSWLRLPSAIRLRRGECRRVKHRPIPPDRIQDATEAPRQAPPPRCAARAGPPAARPTRAASRCALLRQHAHAACTSRLRTSRRARFGDVARDGGAPPNCLRAAPARSRH